ncbi:BrnT family toxin [Candidatus Margulisiibacteriota bacterium]
MRFESFIWNKQNVEHIARHNVSIDEAEEVFIENPIIFRSRNNSYAAFGKNESGRYLPVIFTYKEKGVVRIITARDMSEKEKKLYKRKRGT